ncbi:hypothetical protein [Butyrivibrio fibrisolvens]|uniref:hypothetical protein n=1 Tax=Butyrivibrio fibrisolvens TaxID=831 RepID=UPI0003B670D1|nr:hypothetical protein [Butyrivibrio fibrisolvens]
MAQTNRKWYQLDNAAKIIPSTVQGANTRVFRISCELKDLVNPAILQEVLDEVIEEFPYFNSVLRKGLFWYYLEHRDNLHPLVEEENLPPCSQIYFPGRKTLLYRVFYYRNRINLEMFHVLADGTGALIFFRKLVTVYVSKRYNLNLSDWNEETSSKEEKDDDAFRHFYQRSVGLKQLKSLSSKRAYSLKGDPDPDRQPHLIEGCVSVSQFKKLAKEYNTSVGIMATSVYIAAVIDEMSVRDRKKPIVVSVPVNLRQYFPSETTRNFYGTITIVYDLYKQGEELSEIIEYVKQSFADQLSKDKITMTMNSYAALEHNIAVKVVPLFIKNFTVQGINRVAKKGVTSTMSNLGNIDMPPEVGVYIDRFSCFMTAISEQICVSSFKDKMVFGEVSAYTTHEIMLHFFRRLVKMGIDVEVTSSDHNVDIDTVLIWEKNQEREVKFEKPEEENGDMEGEPV